MIRSMTGFGEATRHDDGVHYAVELRSLNNKYFKASIRLPEQLQVLEAELETALRRRITRGSVTLTASFADTSASAALEVNHQALDRYIDQVKQSRAVRAGEMSIDLAALLALPGVLQQPAGDESRLHQARAVLLGLVSAACDHLISMRRREGNLLMEELTGHRDLIADRLAKIKAQAPRVIEEYETRLRQRMQQMLREAQISVEPAELIREIAVYAEKTDIAEEVSRLGGHIEQFSDLLDAPEDQPVGRTLDFLAQEMLREANTIASKSPDSLISRLIVEVKGAIDRIKEQVQNVE
ncbi:MAG TPA: YicC/YloC family endoribonuclease [Phycisphaerales bacterium]|nr:YicC/YloC family endoribonuclease [Phycisphaerales bacterium]